MELKVPSCGLVRHLLATEMVHGRTQKWDNYIDRLVVSTPLKNMKVSWDDYSQYIMEK